MQLQDAIRAGTAGSINLALMNYNAAVASVANPAAQVTAATTASGAWAVGAGNSVIFATNTGSLAFVQANRVTITTGGSFFLGTGVTATTVPPLPLMGASSPASFSFIELSAGAALPGGGAIQNGSTTTSGGTITIVNSLFSGNSTTAPAVQGGGGGAIFNNGSATIANSTFSNNTALLTSRGGAIANNGALFITGSSFSQNSSFVSGGAIYNQGTATIIGSDFNGNFLTGQNTGGAIYNAGQMMIGTSTIRNNRGTQGAGAINDVGTGASLTITNSTISTNSATFGGASGFLQRRRD